MTGPIEFENSDRINTTRVSTANPLPVSATLGGATPVTPTAAAASAIVTAGVAVSVVTTGCNGGFITNPYNAASQGIASVENLYLDMVNTPGSTDAGGNGTTVVLEPGQTFALPALPNTVTVKVNAATAGHKFTAVQW